MQASASTHVTGPHAPQPHAPQPRSHIGQRRQLFQPHAAAPEHERAVTDFGKPAQPGKPRFPQHPKTAFTGRRPNPKQPAGNSATGQPRTGLKRSHTSPNSSGGTPGAYRDACMQGIFAASQVSDLQHIWQQFSSGSKEYRYHMKVLHVCATMARIPKVLSPGPVQDSTASRSSSNKPDPASIRAAVDLTLQLMDYLATRDGQPTPRGIINSLWAVAKVSEAALADPTLADTAMAQLLDRKLLISQWVVHVCSETTLAQVKTQEVSNLAYSMCRLSAIGLLAKARQDQGLAALWGHLVSYIVDSKALAAMESSALAALLWSLASADVPVQPELYGQLLVTATRRFARLKQQEQSMVVWSAGTTAANLSKQDLASHIPAVAPAHLQQDASVSSSDSSSGVAGSGGSGFEQQTVRDALHHLVHTAVCKLDMTEGFWHSQHVANIIWGLATLTLALEDGPTSATTLGDSNTEAPRPGEPDTLAQETQALTVRLCKQADQVFVANSARFKPQEMAMLSWGLVRLSGSCSHRLMELMADDLERRPHQHLPKNLACFAWAAAGAVDEAGLDRTRLSYLMRQSRGLYTSMTDMTGGQEDGAPGVQGSAAQKRLASTVFGILYLAAVNSQARAQQGSWQRRNGRTLDAFKGQEIAGILTACVKLQAAGKAETELLVSSLIPRCDPMAPAYRGGASAAALMAQQTGSHPDIDPEAPTSAATDSDTRNPTDAAPPRSSSPSRHKHHRSVATSPHAVPHKFNARDFTLSEQISLVTAAAYLGAPSTVLCRHVGAAVKAAASRTIAFAEAQLAELQAGQQQAATWDANKRASGARPASALVDGSSSGSGGRGAPAKRHGVPEGPLLGFKDLADACWGFSLSGHTDKVLFHVMACAARALLELRHAQVKARGGTYDLATVAPGTHITPDGINSLTRALAAVNYQNEALMEAVVVAARSMLGFCSAHQLVALVTSVSHSSHYDLDLMNELAIAALGCMDDFNWHDIANLLWSYANLHTYHPGLFKAALQRVVAGLGRSTDILPRQAACMLWSCVVLRHDDPVGLAQLFRHVWSAGAPEVFDKDARIQVMLSYVMTILAGKEQLERLTGQDLGPRLQQLVEQHKDSPDGVMDVMLRELRLVRDEHSGDSSAQTPTVPRRRGRPPRTSTTVSSHVAGVFLPPPMPPQHRAGYWAHWAEAKRHLIVSDFQLDVHEVLKAMGVSAESEVSLWGGLGVVDFLVQWRGRQVAVEADGPHHFSRNIPHHPLGSTVARNRCLQMLGVPLACVHYVDWMAVRAADQGATGGGDARSGTGAVHRAMEGAPQVVVLGKAGGGAVTGRGGQSKGAAALAAEPGAEVQRGVMGSSAWPPPLSWPSSVVSVEADAERRGGGEDRGHQSGGSAQAALLVRLLDAAIGYVPEQATPVRRRRNSKTAEPGMLVAGNVSSDSQGSGSVQGTSEGGSEQGSGELRGTEQVQKAGQGASRPGRRRSGKAADSQATEVSEGSSDVVEVESSTLTGVRQGLNGNGDTETVSRRRKDKVVMQVKFSSFRSKRILDP